MEKNTAVGGLLDTMRKLAEIREIMRRINWTLREVEDVQLGVDMDALWMHLDNACGRASTCIADITRIKAGRRE